LGASTVCLTKGKEGVAVSDKEEGFMFQEAKKIQEVKDATGAGDAFWTGFLYAKIAQKSLEECITVAQNLAAIKLQTLGTLPENLDILKIIQAS
jgi:fructokinase